MNTTLLTIISLCLTLTLPAQIDTITDTRDGQKYATVVIDSLIWFKQNLNYQTNDSDCYENDSLKCGTWGRLYNRQDALTACPVGWRLPNVKDWDALDSMDIFSLLDTVYWKNSDRHTNATGLSLQPSGIKHKKKFWNQYINSTIWFEDRDHPDSNWHLHVHGDNSPDTTHVFHTHDDLIDK